jgi:hypothetical protein
MFKVPARGTDAPLPSSTEALENDAKQKSLLSLRVFKNRTDGIFQGPLYLAVRGAGRVEACDRFSRTSGFDRLGQHQGTSENRCARSDRRRPVVFSNPRD